MNDNKSCPKHTCITGIRWDAAAGLQRAAEASQELGADMEGSAGQAVGENQ